MSWGAVKERLQTLADVLEAKVPFPAHPKPVRSFALVSYCCIETQQEHFLLLLPPLHPFSEAVVKCEGYSLLKERNADASPAFSFLSGFAIVQLSHLQSEDSWK